MDMKLGLDLEKNVLITSCQVHEEEVLGHKYTYEEWFGISFFRNVNNSSVNAVGSNLFIGKHQVIDYIDYKDLFGYIPKLYTVRSFDGNYARFLCGFDLFDDGSAWANGIKFKNVEDAIAYLESEFKGFRLYLEEPMRLF